MLIYLQFQTDIFFWKKESNKWSQTTETLIIKIDAKKKNPFIHVEISQRNIIKKIVTTNQRHIRLPTICWLMDTCAMSVNLYISNCECNSLANIDWIKARIYFNFFMPFFFFIHILFFVIHILLLIYVSGSGSNMLAPCIFLLMTSILILR